jgi:Tol biopolymer transport system component
LKNPGPHFDFTPDGNWIVYEDKDSDGKDGLFHIAVTGGSPERLGDGVPGSHMGMLRVSPDGRKVLVVSMNTGGNANEIWSLENFSPGVTKQ